MEICYVTPIFKKCDKQLIEHYRPISLLPLCGKIFEKIIFNNFYKNLTTHHLITKNMAFSTTGLLNTHVIFVFRHGKHLM